MPQTINYFRFFSAALLAVTSLKTLGQQIDTLSYHFQKQNQFLTEQPCTQGQIISKRAMNLFLADRVGYFMSSDQNLSFCKNNININTATGVFALTHSLFEPTGEDASVRNFNAIGLRVNAFDAMGSIINSKKYSNQIGITFKRFWLSSPNVTLNHCSEKLLSDAKRSAILKRVSADFVQKSKEFLQYIHEQNNLDATTKTQLISEYFESNNELYSRQYAEAQMEDLFQNIRFKKLRLHYTNFNLYIPLLRQQFTDISGTWSARSYPAEASIMHTRFSENGKKNKNFWINTFAIWGNNSYNSTSDFTFKQFITSTLRSQWVVFPPDYHFGISVALEQNIGYYNATNATIGLPIVLIDKRSFAHTNFEIQIQLPDLGNQVFNNLLKDRIYIGLSFGQPIGRNVY